MKRLALAASLAAVMVIAAAPRAQAESQLDFTVVNSTGYGIKGLYISPTSADDWQENVLTEVLEHGESIAIEFSRKSESVKKWDVMVEWVDEDKPVYWRGYTLAEIAQITLKYDRESGTTTAIAE